MDALDEFRVVEVQRLVCIFSRRKATGQLEDERTDSTVGEEGTVSSGFQGVQKGVYGL